MVFAESTGVYHWTKRVKPLSNGRQEPIRKRKAVGKESSHVHSTILLLLVFMGFGVRVSREPMCSQPPMLPKMPFNSWSPMWWDYRYKLSLQLFWHEWGLFAVAITHGHWTPVFSFECNPAPATFQKASSTRLRLHHQSLWFWGFWIPRMVPLGLQPANSYCRTIQLPNIQNDLINPFIQIQLIPCIWKTDQYTQLHSKEAGEKKSGICNFFKK